MIVCYLCKTPFKDQIDPTSHEAAYLIQQGTYPPGMSEFATTVSPPMIREVCHRECLEKIQKKYNGER